MERNQAFEILRTLILDGPMTHEYKIKLLDAFTAYMKTIYCIHENIIIMETEMTIQTNITEAEEIFCFYKKGREGSFMTSLINTIFRGDDRNQAKIAKGYPELVEVIKRYGGEKGYWEDLVKRWNKEYPLLKLVA